MLLLHSTDCSLLLSAMAIPVPLHFDNFPSPYFCVTASDYPQSFSFCAIDFSLTFLRSLLWIIFSLEERVMLSIGMHLHSLITMIRFHHHRQGPCPETWAIMAFHSSLCKEAFNMVLLLSYLLPDLSLRLPRSIFLRLPLARFPSSLPVKTMLSRWRFL